MSSSCFASERELIEHAKQFQPEAWDQIYETYFSKMYNFVYVHVGDRTAAEDLASEVFEQACKGIHRFQYRGVPFSSWLYRIAHNLMVDFLKRRRRAPSRSLEAGGQAASKRQARLAAKIREASYLEGRPLPFSLAGRGLTVSRWARR